MRRNFFSRLTYHVAEGVLLIGSGLAMLGVLLVIANVVIGVKPYVRLSDNSVFGFTSYTKGFPVKTDVYQSIPDTSAKVNYHTASGSQVQSGFSSYKDDIYSSERLRADVQPGDSIVYADTIMTSFERYSSGPKPDPSIRSAEITQMTFYLQPNGVWEKLKYALPFILNGLLITWCAWHLYRILLFIKGGEPFGSSNAERLMKIGYAIVAVQLLFFVLTFFPPYTDELHANLNSTIPHYRVPFNLWGRIESPFDIAWLGVGTIILIFASAFKRGDRLQEAYDSTI